MARPYTYVIADGGDCAGSEWHRAYGVRVYEARNGELPRSLEGRTPEPHTWPAHLQRRINDEPYTPLGERARTPIFLREYQAPRVEEITAAHRSGGPGYLLGYPTGSGKTYISVEAINRIRPRRVLVIAPVSHLMGWRSVISQHAEGLTEWVVINPDRLHTLFRLPEDDPQDLMDVPASDRASHAIRWGEPITEFDVVVTDESQILAHAETDRASLWRRLIGWQEDGSPPSAFTLNLSATSWSHPAETHSAAHLLAHIKGVPVPPENILLLDYLGWLRNRVGVELAQNRQGKWTWKDDAGGVHALTSLLYERGLGATEDRETLGLPNQDRSLRFIELSPTDRERYDLEWNEFRTLYGRSRVDNVEPGTGREAYLRNLQKAAQIKAPYIADLAVDYLSDGYQVVLVAWFHDTMLALNKAVDRIASQRQLTAPPSRQWALALAGTDVFGRSIPPARRDQSIRAFQSGLVTVLITSVVEAISLHAGQANAGIDGRDATDARRVTIFGDVLHGGKKAFQAEGRATRDAQRAEAIYCIAADTKEVSAFSGAFRNLANTAALTTIGDQLLTNADIASFQEMHEELEQMTNEGGTA